MDNTSQDFSIKHFGDTEDEVADPEISADEKSDHTIR